MYRYKLTSLTGVIFPTNNGGKPMGWRAAETYSDKNNGFSEEYGTAVDRLIDEVGEEVNGEMVVSKRKVYDYIVTHANDDDRFIFAKPKLYRTRPEDIEFNIFVDKMAIRTM